MRARGAGCRDHARSTPPTCTRTRPPSPCSAMRCSGQRRESLEIFTKAYFATGPGRTQRLGPARASTSWSRSTARCDVSAPITSTSTRRTAGTMPRRWRRRWWRFADIVRSGKALVHRGERMERRAAARRRGAREGAAHPASCRTSRSTRRSGGSSRQRSSPPRASSGISQIVWSPVAQGVLTGKYLPGHAAARGQPCPRRERRRRPQQPAGMRDDVLARVQQLDADRRRAVAHDGSSSPSRWVLQNDNVAAALIAAPH